MRYAAGWSSAAEDVDMNDSFAPGTVVIVTLNMPREKFWGTLLALTPAGASLRGIDLNSVDDFARQVRDGDEVNANVVFFPMHRIERIESDARNGEIPSPRTLRKQGGTRIHISAAGRLVLQRHRIFSHRTDSRAAFFCFDVRLLTQ